MCVANVSPVKSLISKFSATSLVNVAISARVISAPRAFPRLFSIVRRRFASGMDTGGDTWTGPFVPNTPAKARNSARFTVPSPLKSPGHTGACLNVSTACVTSRF